MNEIISLILIIVSWHTKDPTWAIAAGLFALAAELYLVHKKLCDNDKEY